MFFFLKRDTKISLFCITYSIFSPLFCRKMFRNLVCAVIAFDNSFLKKGIWLPPACFFLRGACLLKASRFMWQNLWKPSSLLTTFYLGKLLINVSLYFSLEKFLYNFCIYCFRLIFLKTFSHDSQSHQMEIRQPCLYYASTLKAARYICKNQIYTYWITWDFTACRLPNYIF